MRVRARLSPSSARCSDPWGGGSGQVLSDVLLVQAPPKCCDEGHFRALWIRFDPMLIQMCSFGSNPPGIGGLWRKLGFGSGRSSLVSLSESVFTDVLLIES